MPPLEVQVSISVQSIGPINEIDHAFGAKLWIDLWWDPTQEERDAHAKGDMCSPSFNAVENLQPVTSISVDTLETRRGPTLKIVGGALVWHEIVELRGTFNDAFDLHSFPFDCQVLSLTLEMGNIKDMVYVPAKHLTYGMSLESHRCCINNWDVFDIGIAYTASDVSHSKSGNRYAQVVLSFAVAREWWPCGTRILSTAFGLNLTSLCTFALEAHDVSDRLGFLLTLVLAFVAFTLVVDGQLPKTPYTTYNDRYMMSSYLCFFLMMFVVAAIPWSSVKWDFDLQELDSIVFTTSIIIVSSVQALAAGSAAFLRKIEKAKLTDPTRHEFTDNMKVKTSVADYTEIESGASFTCKDSHSHISHLPSGRPPVNASERKPLLSAMCSP